jgi:succinyl-CoA synthetase alpha subunit
MAILLDEHSRVLVQGITGREGSNRARFMAAYGTNVVAGVTPGRGGQTVGSVPVYNSVKEAIDTHGPFDATVTFVPGPVVKDAVIEAVDAGVKFVVMPVERVPLHDALNMLAHARDRGARARSASSAPARRSPDGSADRKTSFRKCCGRGTWASSRGAADRP